MITMRRPDSAPAIIRVFNRRAESNLENIKGKKVNTANAVVEPRENRVPTRNKNSIAVINKTAIVHESNNFGKCFTGFSKNGTIKIKMP